MIIKMKFTEKMHDIYTLIRNKQVNQNKFIFQNLLGVI